MPTAPLPCALQGAIWARRQRCVRCARCTALQVLLRTWRQDGDGSYIVLYQSTTHGGAPEHAGGGLSWRQPVRAKVSRKGRGSLTAQPQPFVVPSHEQEHFQSFLQRAQKVCVLC